MEKLKDRKIIGIIIIFIVVIIVSVLAYGKDNNNIFKDKYMESIFIEEDNSVIESIEEKTDDSLNNLKENNNVTSDVNINEDKNTIVVEVKGEVIKPDVYILDEGSIIKDLIEVAGGLTKEADISNINRAKELKNHELIVIKNINNHEEVAIISDNIISEESDDGLISINDADLSKLTQIQGIGEVKASAIISYREKNGGFKSIEELKNVDGIGEKTFEKIKEGIKL